MSETRIPQRDFSDGRVSSDPWEGVPTLSVGANGTLLLDGAKTRELKQQIDDGETAAVTMGADGSVLEVDAVDGQEPSFDWGDHIWPRNSFFLKPLFFADSGKFGNTGDFEASRFFQRFLPPRGFAVGQRLGMRKFFGEVGAHFAFRLALDGGWGLSKQLQSDSLGVPNDGYPTSWNTWLSEKVGASEENLYLGAFATTGAYALAQTGVQYNLQNRLVPMLERSAFLQERASSMGGRLLYGKNWVGPNVMPATRAQIAGKFFAINAGTFLGWTAFDMGLMLVNQDKWDDLEGSFFERLGHTMWLYGPTGDMGPTLAMFTNAGHIGGNAGELAFDFLVEGRGRKPFDWMANRMRERTDALRLLRQPPETFFASGTKASKAGLGLSFEASIDDIGRQLKGLYAVERPRMLQDGGEGALKWARTMEQGVARVDEVAATAKKAGDTLREMKGIAEAGGSRAQVKGLAASARQAQQELGQLAGEMMAAAEEDFIKYRPENAADASKFGERFKAMSRDLRAQAEEIGVVLKPKVSVVPTGPKRIWHEGYKSTSRIKSWVNKGCRWVAKGLQGKNVARYAFDIAGNVAAIFLTNYMLEKFFYEDAIPAVYRNDIDTSLYEVDLPEAKEE